jgi:hypothetical protein
MSNAFSENSYYTYQNIGCNIKKMLKKISSSHIKSKYVVTTKPYLATS